MNELVHVVHGFRLEEAVFPFRMTTVPEVSISQVLSSFGDVTGLNTGLPVVELPVCTCCGLREQEI